MAQIIQQQVKRHDCKLHPIEVESTVMGRDATRVLVIHVGVLQGPAPLKSDPTNDDASIPLCPTCRATGSTKTPGFMMPSGSTTCLAAASMWRNRAGTSRS